ncbi:MAG: hypothetical protein ACYCXU_09490, partial [Thermoleophilia bacterium]
LQLKFVAAICTLDDKNINLFGVIDMSQKNGFTKPFVRDKKVVDLTGSYSNLSILNQLERAVNRLIIA